MVHYRNAAGAVHEVVSLGRLERSRLGNEKTVTLANALGHLRTVTAKPLRKNRQAILVLVDTPATTLPTELVHPLLCKYACFNIHALAALYGINSCQLLPATNTIRKDPKSMTAFHIVNEDRDALEALFQNRNSRFVESATRVLGYMASFDVSSDTNRP